MVCEFPISIKTMGYILSKQAANEFPIYKDHGLYFVKNRLKIIVNTSSERPLSKLSEIHKISIIVPTELKLWPFKNALFNAMALSF